MCEEKILLDSQDMYPAPDMSIPAFWAAVKRGNHGLCFWAKLEPEASSRLYIRKEKEASSGDLSSLLITFIKI